MDSAVASRALIGQARASWGEMRYPGVSHTPGHCQSHLVDRPSRTSCCSGSLQSQRVMVTDDPWRKAIRKAHDSAFATLEPGYLDLEMGLFLLTAVEPALAVRSSCCDQGCRHGPLSESRV